MKRFVKRNIKYIFTALLLLIVLCIAIRGIHIRSVQDVRQEARELAGITGNNDSESQGAGRNADPDVGNGSDNTVEDSSDGGMLEADGAKQNPIEDGETDSAKKSQEAKKTDNSSDRQTMAEENKNTAAGKTSAGKNEKNATGKSSAAKKKSAGKGKKNSSGKQSSVQNTGKSGKQQTKASNTTSSKRKISDGSATKPDQYHTDPVPSGRPEPVNAEDQTVNQKRSFYVYLSIDVKTILDHMEDLKPGLQKYIPEDGWILPKTQVLCYEGETAWDVMSRECKARGINVQSSYTPLYNSVYMEGINHIGEFDCGATAGWVYEVDGWIPNYSSSRYVMVEGEYLRWRYSCTGFGSDLDGAVRQ